jgi:formylglycine-generating enzyme required for sulfatase activity
MKLCNVFAFCWQGGLQEIIMEHLSYLDFKLTIGSHGDQYRAAVKRASGKEASHEFALPFFRRDLELLLVKNYSNETAILRKLGGQLFESLFSGDLLECFRERQARARGEMKGLRLRLTFNDAPELMDMPWEFLFDPEKKSFLAQSNRTPIVRYMKMPRMQPLEAQFPLRILVVISSPKDYPPLDTKREISLLTQALGLLYKTGKIRVKIISGRFKTIQKCLRRERYHVFHFIGHGKFDENTDEGVLVLEDDRKRGIIADASRIRVLLHDHWSLRLAVLNSCEGARNSVTDPFAGVAVSLIRQGIPAVVAMQFDISDKAAITFADVFYTALTDGLPADAAMAEGRKGIYGDMCNDVEWGTPVFYTSSKDGILFRFPGQQYQEFKTDRYQRNNNIKAIEKSGRPEFKTDYKIEIIQPELFTEPITGMEFVHVSTGTFMMGDNFGDGDADEYPVHEVELDTFYMGRYPVTQKQWMKIMERNPSKFQKGDNHPVENVSWYDAQLFVKKLVEANNKKYKFRLPTEAEWEYTARSGGKKEKYAGGDEIDAVAWYEKNSDGSTHPVGNKRPNGLGIYDMSGNVWEWCLDLHEAYPTGSVKNPIQCPSDSCPIFRGGSWSDTERVCRSSYRIGASAYKYGEHLGFRLIKIP